MLVLTFSRTEQTSPEQDTVTFTSRGKRWGCFPWWRSVFSHCYNISFACIPRCLWLLAWAVTPGALFPGNLRCGPGASSPSRWSAFSFHSFPGMSLVLEWRAGCFLLVLHKANRRLRATGWLLFANLISLGRAQRLGLQEAVIHSVYGFLNKTISIVYECWVGEHVCIGGSAWAQAKNMCALCVYVLLGLLRGLGHYSLGYRPMVCPGLASSEHQVQQRLCMG